MSMVAFLAGLGGGYLKGKQQGLENDRQARMDKIAEDRAAREQAQYDEEVAGKQRLKEASASANLNTDTPSLDTGDGPKLYAMPKGVDSGDVASSDARQFSRMADVTGTQAQPPVISGGTATMNGKAYGSADEATKAADQYNSPDAVNGRLANAYRANGKPMEAMQMQAAAQQAKLTELGINKAQAEHLQALHEKNLNNEIEAAGGNVPAAAAAMLTKTSLTGKNKYEWRPATKPGGMGSIVQIGEDGAETVHSQVADTTAGHALLYSKLANLSPDKKIHVAFEAANAERQAAQDAMANDHWEKTFKQADDHFNQTKDLQKWQIGISGAHLKLAQQDEARKAVLFAQETKIPDAVKKSYASLESSAKIMDTALAKSQAEGTFTPENPVTKKMVIDRASIGQQMSDMMKPYMDSAKSKTGSSSAPDPLGLRVTATAAPATATTVNPGTAPAPTPPKVSMEATAKAEPAPVVPPGPRPVRGADEPHQSFKDRLISWDQTRMAYEDAVSKEDEAAKSEALRRAAVANRPDLMQMGRGLR